MIDYFNFQYFDYIGILGAIIILFFFALNQFNKIKNNSIYYDFGNFFGSIFLVFFAIKTNSIPFILLNTIWALISIKDIYLFFKFKK